MHQSIEECAEQLLNNEVVGIPTETVYGLAASLKSPSAIAKIFAIKGRPSNNPLIVHLASAEELTTYVDKLPEMTHELALAFWPGPMTLVMPVKMDAIPEIARAGLTTAAFRVPNHPLTLAVLKLTGPLVMPSANLSGKPSATTAQHVETDFGITFPVLNGGSSKSGVESTILYWKETNGQGRWIVIRLGALPPEAFNAVLGYTPEIEREKKEILEKPLCPGQLYRHYAPQAELILVTEIPKEADVVIGFENREYPHAERLFYLGLSQDPHTATQRIYAILRQLDAEKIARAWVDMSFPAAGLWLTLQERLLKAAHS